MYNSTERLNNYLIEKPQYTLSYNDNIKGPNWVSWQLNRSWLGSVRRQDVEQTPTGYYSIFPPSFSTDFTQFTNGITPIDGTFRADQNDFPWLADQSLPATWIKTQGPDYQFNNNIPNRRLDRGHMTPYQDRSRTFKDAYSTYLTTNVLPPNGYLNTTAWRILEEASRDFVNNYNADLHIIAGGFGYDLNRENPNQVRNPDPFPGHPNPIPGVIRNLVQGTINAGGSFVPDRNQRGQIITSYGTTNHEWIPNPKRIGVPDYIWKIIVPLQPGQGISDITANTAVTAVIMPNVDPRQLQNNTFVLPNGHNLLITQPGNWRQYQVSVRDLEEIAALTGNPYIFLQNLPEPIRTLVKGRRDADFSL